MRRIIKNFTLDYELDVSSTTLGQEGFVHLYQRHGGLSFIHSMTPSQAREFSTILLLIADDAEEQIKTQNNLEKS